MRNEHMYKKLKHELTLNYMYNANRYRKSYKQIIQNICKYFNVEFNNERCNAITNFCYTFNMRLRSNTSYLFFNNKMLMDYANTHNISIYDMEEHKIINSV